MGPGDWLKSYNWHEKPRGRPGQTLGRLLVRSALTLIALIVVLLIVRAVASGVESDPRERESPDEEPTTRLLIEVAPDQAVGT